MEGVPYDLAAYNRLIGLYCFREEQTYFISPRYSRSGRVTHNQEFIHQLSIL